MMGLSKRSSSAAKVQAPKRVVRAVRNYVARESTELTFKKDDFFYVFSTPHDSDEWYDVTNPLTGERGLAPSSFFEVMESRQDRINRINRSDSNASNTAPFLAPLSSSTSSSSNDNGSGGNGNAGVVGHLGLPRSMPTNVTISSLQHSSESGTLRRPSAGAGSQPPADLSSMMTLRARTTSIQHQHYAHHHQHQRQTSNSLPAVIEMHGTALYDFAAANNNELGVREGDDLLIVAQSTEDWLIGRSVLGGKKTALVPAAYVQLHDHITSAPVSDLCAYFARNHVRLRTAPEWERYQREVRMSQSTRSSTSASSDLTTTVNTGIGAHIHVGRTASQSSSAYDEDQSPTPRSSIGSVLPAPGMGIQKSRNRALTASSSTSSIAERSSFRQLHKGRQVSGSSLQHIINENFPRFHPNEIVAACVPSFICKDGAYLFQISLRLDSGEQRNIYRGYEDIICCRNLLNKSFPKETSPLKLARISTHSSSMLYLNDTIAERRRNEIDEYINGLLNMSPEVVESTVVQRLFGSRTDSLPDHHQQVHCVQTSLHDSHAKHATSMSEDSSRGLSFTPASASSTDTAVDAHHSVDGGVYGSAYASKTLSCDSKLTAVTEPPATMPRQLMHKPSSCALGSTSATVKVKIRLGSDMVALRLPSELTLEELKARIAMKLSSGETAQTTAGISKINYLAPSGESAPLSDDQDWADALLVTNNKPVLTIVQ
ncbi:bud emergence protein 1 [Coemansia sp. RSA 1365]|nr:bud emergence protein 1 [Coemansia sp. RSA 1365]